MFHVLIPAHNRLELTINCLSSLKNQKDYDNLNIIIIDDASTDGTDEYLKKNFPEITILKGDGSLYWCGAIHLGVEHVVKICKIEDWVLVVNNDVELSPNAISELVKISKKKERKVLSGALTLSSEDRQTIIKSGTVVENWMLNKTKHPLKGLNVNEVDIIEPINVDFLTGRCLLHPVEVFSKVGNYDSKTFIHYGGDDEFSMRVKKFGYLTLLCPSSIVFLKPNDPIISEKISIKKLFHVLFSIKSSSNIVNKIKLTMKVVPFYAKLSFFIVGVIKSFYIFSKNEIKK